jgi:DNA invertase Pin-like site-specific DNA recombinase
MKNAIGYARVSSDEQAETGASLEGQIQSIRSYCQKNNLNLVVEIFDDETGMTLNRPGFTELQNQLASRTATAVVAYESHRISRNPLDYVKLRDEWAAKGIELHYTQRGLIDLNSLGGAVVEDIQGRFADYWRKEFLKMCRMGKRTRATQGYVQVNSRPPYGYRAVDGKLIIEESEAEIVRLIFRLYAIDRLSLAKIADYLTEKKIPTWSDLRGHFQKKKKYGEWGTTGVIRVLKNETYTGVWYWGKNTSVKVEGKHHHVPNPIDDLIAVEVPTIIDRAIFDRAQVIMAKNKAMASRNTKHGYLMLKRIKCPLCGRILQGRLANHQYYRCGSHHRYVTADPCGLPHFRVDLIDNIVWTWIKRILSDPDYSSRLIDQALKGDIGQEGQLETTLRQNRERQEKLMRQLKRLLLAFADEAEEEDIKEARAALKNELNRLKTEEKELGLSLNLILERRAAVVRFAEVYRVFSEGLETYNEPFDIKQGWVEVLDVSAEIMPDFKNIRLTCLLDSTVLSIVDQFTGKLVYKLQDILVLSP